MENMVVAAHVGAPRGLRGEVTLHLATDRADTCLAPGEVVKTMNPDFPVLTVERLVYAKGKAYAFFEEVRDRNDSEALTGTDLLVPEELEDDAWYPRELEGLPVLDLAGQTLGTVIKLELGAAQDRLLVKTDSGDVMVPFVEALVPVVDVAAGKIIVDAPEGLF